TSRGEAVSRGGGDVLAVEGDGPGVALIVAAHHIDHRRLARAVRSDEAEDLAGPDLERDAGESLKAAKRLLHVGADEQWGARWYGDTFPRSLSRGLRRGDRWLRGRTPPPPAQPAGDTVGQEDDDGDQDRAEQRAVQDRTVAAGEGLGERGDDDRADGWAVPEPGAAECRHHDRVHGEADRECLGDRHVR